MSKSQIQSTVVMRYCNKLRTAGDLQLAAGICRRAHELDPTNPEPLIKLAEILQMLKLVPQAGEAYRAALLLDPTRTEATYGLGKVYMAQQRYDLAAAQFETAIFQDGENARYHNALAIVRDQQGDHQTAQLLYRHALELDPQNAGIRNNLGLSVTLAAKAPEQAPNHIASSSLGGLSLAKDADVAHDGDLEHPPAASTAKTTPARLATSVSPPPRRIMDEPEPKAEPTKASAVPMAEPEMAKATAAAHPAKPASSAMSGDLVYIAQLGSYGSESRAWQGWSDLQGTANDLLGTMKAMVVPADLGERGTFYRPAHGTPGERDGGTGALRLALRIRLRLLAGQGSACQPARCVHAGEETDDDVGAARQPGARQRSGREDRAGHAVGDRLQIAELSPVRLRARRAARPPGLIGEALETPDSAEASPFACEASADFRTAADSRTNVTSVVARYSAIAPPSTQAFCEMTSSPVIPRKPPAALLRPSSPAS